MARSEILEAFRLLVLQVEDVHGPAARRHLVPTALTTLRNKERASCLWFVTEGPGSWRRGNFGFHLDFDLVGLEPSFEAWGSPGGNYVKATVSGPKITFDLMRGCAVMVGLLAPEQEL